MIITLEQRLTLDEIRCILYEGATLMLSDKAKDNINKSYEFLKSFSSDKVIYGINTGLGLWLSIEWKTVFYVNYNTI